MAKRTNEMTKKDLLVRIEYLEQQVKEMFEKHDQEFFVSFPWAGNLGQWYWYYDTNRVTFNDKKITTLGYLPQDIGNVGFEFFTEKLHPEDYSYVMNNMINHLKGKTEAYEVEYRIQHKDGHYLWYYDRGVVTKRDRQGKSLMLQGVVFDITNSKKVEDQLRELSERDSLTQVYNRRLFFRDLELLIQQQRFPFSILMFDIDHFKRINDHYGHLVGDEVLIKLTKYLNLQLKENHEIYRYGGEEFFVIMPNTAINEAVEIAKNMHQQIRKLEIDVVGHITVSIGIAECQKDETMDDVVKRVDDLMYDAKHAGKNTIKY